ncbi:hypothetical protein TCAL_16494 [Tigriopus californicus]|uniref:Ionotropic glutamate receptor L-glutamate and glycine-binding domain-containing protein n=1 Tax=Tigriopus californicus TaxID=6832 RepID=A0A553NS46_TIGCA|nr:hypothetical protein TCAL_16494 [Tigriopus californicus]
MWLTPHQIILFLVLIDSFISVCCAKELNQRFLSETLDHFRKFHPTIGQPCTLVTNARAEDPNTSKIIIDSIPTHLNPSSDHLIHVFCGRVSGSFWNYNVSFWNPRLGFGQSLDFLGACPPSLWNQTLDVGLAGIKPMVIPGEEGTDREIRGTDIRPLQIMAEMYNMELNFVFGDTGYITPGYTNATGYLGEEPELYRNPNSGIDFVLMTFTTFVEPDPLPWFPKWSTGRLVVLYWSLFAFLVVNFYTSNLRTNLIAPAYENRIDTTEDFLESGRELFVHSSGYWMIRLGTEGKLKEVIKMLRDEQWRFYPNERMSQDQLNIWVQERGYVIVAYPEGLMLNYLSIPDYEGLPHQTYSKEIIHTSFNAIRFQKYSPITPHLNRILTAADEFGLYYKFLYEYVPTLAMPGQYIAGQINESELRMEVDMILGPIFILICGGTLGTIAFIFELLIHVFCGRVSGSFWNYNVSFWNPRLGFGQSLDFLGACPPSLWNQTLDVGLAGIKPMVIPGEEGTDREIRGTDIRPLQIMAEMYNMELNFVFGDTGYITPGYTNATGYLGEEPELYRNPNSGIDFVLMTFTTFVEPDPLPWFPKWSTGRLVVLYWSLFAFLVVNFYTSNLRTNLIAPAYENRIDTTEDFLESGRELFVHSSGYWMIRLGTEGKLKEVIKMLRDEQWRFYPNERMSQDQLNIWVQERGYVIVAYPEGLMLNYLSIPDYEGLPHQTYSKEIIHTSFNAIRFQKYSPITPHLNRILTAADEFGLYYKFLYEYVPTLAMPGQYIAGQINESELRMEVDMILGPIFILICGGTLGTIAFIFELVFAARLAKALPIVTVPTK